MSSWSGAYSWHEPHPAHVFHAPGPGVLVPATYFNTVLRKDVAHPHTAAHGVSPVADKPATSPKPDFSGGTAVHTNDQAGIAGTSKAYGRFAAPYGTVDKTSPSVLKYYPMEGQHQAAEALVTHHGYQYYLAGGKYGKPDLANRHYGNKNLMIYDPSADSGGDFGDESYTKSWRLTHELAHALTYPELNQKYGEGRRIGRLGAHRTLREAKRAVEWEWLASHKQRELSRSIGVHIPDEAFHQELNTVMHDAVHRAVTGKFTDPQAEGFRPHAHKVPLETALGMLDESANQLGLKHEHDLLQKAVEQKLYQVRSMNLSDTSEPKKPMSDQVTRKTVAIALATSLKGVLAKHEAAITALRVKEDKGATKLLAKSAKCPSCKEPAQRIGMTDGGRSVHYDCGKCNKEFSLQGDHKDVSPRDLDDSDLEKAEHCKVEKCGDLTHGHDVTKNADCMPGTSGAMMKNGIDDGSGAHCPACDAPNSPMGALGNMEHFLCRGCGAAYHRAAEQPQEVRGETAPSLNKAGDRYHNDDKKPPISHPKSQPSPAKPPLPARPDYPTNDPAWKMNPASPSDDGEGWGLDSCPTCDGTDHDQASQPFSIEHKFQHPNPKSVYMHCPSCDQSFVMQPPSRVRAAATQKSEDFIDTKNANNDKRVKNVGAEGVMPDDKAPKVVKVGTEGVKKGKMAKNLRKDVPPVRLPGMPKVFGSAIKPSAEPPALGQLASAAMAGAPKNSPVPPPIPAAAQKPASGVAAAVPSPGGAGFLKGLFAKFGHGQKLAMSEDDMAKVAGSGIPAAPKAPGAPKVTKATAEEANKEVQNFRSIASNPTAMPKFPKQATLGTPAGSKK